MIWPPLCILGSTFALAAIHAAAHYQEHRTLPPYLRALRALPLSWRVSAGLAVGVGVAWLWRAPRARREGVPPPMTGTPSKVVRTAGDLIVQNGSAKRLEIERAAEDPERLAAIMREQR